MCGVLLLPKSFSRKLDFSRDTPHDSTHPYTTFDHSSRTRGREVMFFCNGMTIPDLVAPMRGAPLAGVEGGAAG